MDMVSGVVDEWWAWWAGGGWVMGMVGGVVDGWWVMVDGAVARW